MTPKDATPYADFIALLEKLETAEQQEKEEEARLDVGQRIARQEERVAFLRRKVEAAEQEERQRNELIAELEALSAKISELERQTRAPLLRVQISEHRRAIIGFEAEIARSERDGDSRPREFYELMAENARLRAALAD